VRRLADGKRVLVLDCTVNFLGEDDIADQAPHLEPGWYYRYTGAVAQPADDEAAADEAREAEKRDGEVIAAVIKDAKGRMEWLPEAQAWGRPGSPAPGRPANAVREGDCKLTLPPWYVLDVEGTDLRPDPDAITTVEGLIAAMRRYRIWAGTPSFRVMARGAASG
jgi:hypothetical protein